MNENTSAKAGRRKPAKFLKGRVSLTMTPSVWRSVSRLANSKGKSASQLIEDLARQELERVEPKPVVSTPLPNSHESVV